MEYMILKKQREIKENCIRKAFHFAKSNTAIGALYLTIFDDMDEARTELQVNAVANDYYTLNRMVNNAVGKSLIKERNANN